MDVDHPFLFAIRDTESDAVLFDQSGLTAPRRCQIARAARGPGWRYDDGRDGPPTVGRVVSECYPYTAIVGAEELRFDVERPQYKR